MLRTADRLPGRRGDFPERRLWTVCQFSSALDTGKSCRLSYPRPYRLTIIMGATSIHSVSSDEKGG